MAGSFYPSENVQLKQTIERCFTDPCFGPGRLPSPTKVKQTIYGMISPHAGLSYSGAVAANGYYEIASTSFDDVVLIGPNHYGIGSMVAAMQTGTWETPMGEVEVNPHLSQLISRNSGMIVFDDFAHSRDHCIEVQIPFLEYIKPHKFGIVPIIIIKQDMQTAIALGNSIARSVSGTQTLLVASSDFTHYERNDDAHRKDIELITAIQSLDVSKFYSILDRLDISACGYGAIAAVMTAVKLLGATSGKLLRYATSGDVTGHTDAVVGYSSVVFI